MSLWKWGSCVVLLLLLGFVPSSCQQQDFTIGSKKFTESVILGEALRLDARARGVDAIHFPQVGGTQIVFQGVLAGDIDIYPEYTGTLIFEIFQLEDYDLEEMRRRVHELGLELSEPLGFNNSYALGMRRDRAESLGITKISDLYDHPELVLRFGNEFIERKDGWVPLKQHYGLQHQDVRGMDHDVAYRELAAGNADVMDVYTTDSKIKLYDIQVLQDDRQFFPRYDAVLLYRREAVEGDTRLQEMVAQFAGSLDDQQMMALNAQAELEQIPEARVAREFLQSEFDFEPEAAEQPSTIWTRLVENTIGHLDLVRSSLVAAILIAIPLGVFSAFFRRFGMVILSLVGIVQTMPALALLVLLIAPVKAIGLSSVGTGSVPVLIALFLYSLLPIVRNTYAGMVNIPQSTLESAEALGLSPLARLFRVDLPMASPSILAGIKTAAIINVGFATLGALIGSPGYGQPILAGIRLADTQLILEGAIPAALLAILVQLLFEGVEWLIVPRGLRL